MTDDDIEVIDDQEAILNKIIDNCVKLCPNSKYALAFAQSLEEQLIDLEAPVLQRILELVQLIRKYEEREQRCKIIRRIVSNKIQQDYSKINKHHKMKDSMLVIEDPLQLVNAVALQYRKV